MPQSDARVMLLVSAALGGRIAHGVVALAFALALAIGSARAAPACEFRVTIDPGVRSEPASGRLIIMLIREGAKLRRDVEPIDGPHWDDPQPIFGMDVKDAAPDRAIVVGASADVFPADLKELAPGTYRAQARLDIHRTDSEWRRHDGNLYSDPVEFTVAPGVPPNAQLRLAHATQIQPPPNAEGVEWFEARSALLSAFRKGEVRLRAGVVFPKNYDPGKMYAAVYEILGFGGNHEAARRVARSRARERDGAEDALARSTFWIVLDPEGPNGHTLFADSANNGPCGEALVKELIPALEAKYPLRRDAAARIVRGHSSGGWSSLWLALTHPEVFGACWSSAPDPVDFRKFQRINIYEQPNFYNTNASDPTDAAGEIASYRGRGTLMTVRQEARGEDVIGPDNTSAQQWDSWFAVFGPRNERGAPAALFDPKTGVIDRAMAERYRAYDIGHRLRAAPEKYGPIFRERVRLIVGEQDSFYLNEAVALLKADLDAHRPGGKNGDEHGYVKIIPGLDHGTVMMSAEARAFPKEMVEHLERQGWVVK